MIVIMEAIKCSMSLKTLFPLLSLRTPPENLQRNIDLWEFQNYSRDKMFPPYLCCVCSITLVFDIKMTIKHYFVMWGLLYLCPQWQNQMSLR